MIRFNKTFKTICTCLGIFTLITRIGVFDPYSKFKGLYLFFVGIVKEEEKFFSLVNVFSLSSFPIFASLKGHFSEKQY